jgi:hypothetical protein
MINELSINEGSLNSRPNSSGFVLSTKDLNNNSSDIFASRSRVSDSSYLDSMKRNNFPLKVGKSYDESLTSHPMQKQKRAQNSRYFMNSSKNRDYQPENNTRNNINSFPLLTCRTYAHNFVPKSRPGLNELMNTREKSSDKSRKTTFLNQGWIIHSKLPNVIKIKSRNHEPPRPKFIMDANEPVKPLDLSKTNATNLNDLDLTIENIMKKFPGIYFVRKREVHRSLPNLNHFLKDKNIKYEFA